MPDLRDGEWITPIKGYPDYGITSQGRVFSYRVHKWLTPYPVEQGQHPFVIIKVNGKRKQLQLRQLVADHYLDTEEGKPKIQHLDGDTHNNVFTNLCRLTEWEYRKWRQRLDEHNYQYYLPKIGRALDEFQVREMRFYAAERNWTPEDLAEKYGVSITTIKSVLEYKTWRDV